MQVSTGYAGRSLAGGTGVLSFRMLFGLSLVGGALARLLLPLTPPAVFRASRALADPARDGLLAYGSFVKKPGDLAAGKHMGRNGALAAQHLHQPSMAATSAAPLAF